MIKKIIQLLIIIIVISIVFYAALSSSNNNSKSSGHLIQKNNNYNLIKNFSTTKRYFQIIKSLDNYFYNEFKKGLFSGNILISIKGQIIYTNAFGWANKNKKELINTNTIFQLGSMSKQFTAIAILQLVSKGVLSLDDEVSKFYPDFPYKGITIRMLLTHRSGLPNYIYQFENSTDIDKNSLMTTQQMVHYLIKNKEKEYFKPNKKFQYNNTGYALLAAIIEKVTGLSFEEYLRKNIFNPLKMNNTFFYTDLYNGKVDSSLHIATGYLSPKHEAGFFYLNGILGDKGLFSSLKDLHTWDTSLYKDYILTKNWIDSALTPKTKTNRANIFYGYGWKIYSLPDSTTIQFHSGWWQGYQSILMRIPKDTISVIVLKNRKTAHPINQMQIIKIFYPNINFKKLKISNKELLESNTNNKSITIS